MPSAAFLAAAKQGNRQPVILLAVESPTALKDAVTTIDDWQASSSIVNINTAAEPGSIILTTNGPDPNAQSYPDPGQTESLLFSPATHFVTSDWNGVVGQSLTFTLDLWTAYTVPTNPLNTASTITVAPHLFDGMAGLVPVTTDSITFEIWGKCNGGSPQLLDTVTINNEAATKDYLVPTAVGTYLPIGAWQFALHLISKVASTKAAYSILPSTPNTPYDTAGPAQLELRAFTENYGVNLTSTHTTPHLTTATWYSVGANNPIAYPCDNWTGYSPQTNPGATAATLLLAPNLLEGYVDLENPVITVSMTIDVWGKLNGGAPQLLVSSAQLNSSEFQTVKLTGLTQGSWSFAIHIIGKLSELLIYTALPQPQYSNGGNNWYAGGSSITFLSYTTNTQSNFLATGSLTTRVFDLGQAPTTNTTFETDQTIPPGCSVAYTALGSNVNNSGWVSLGSVVDGSLLAAYRYYYLTVVLNASPDGLRSPDISELRIQAGSFDYFSTCKDTPIQGAKPYIVDGSLNSLSSNIELMALGKIGEISPKLFWTKQTSDMLATGFLKNKAVTCKIGFVGLAEVDYEPYFGGTWYDHTDDHEQLQITIQTRDVWKQFKTQVPDANYWVDLTGAKITGKVYTLAGNIIDVMLSVASAAGVSDRYVDTAAFLALKAASFPGSTPGTTWYVKRDLTSSQDASALLGDLGIAAGVFLYPAPNGMLTPVHWDTVISGTPAATLDALKIQFKPIAGGQKDLYTRQAISYQLLPGKDGGSASDFGSLYECINAEAETNWGESHTNTWSDTWGLPAQAIVDLGARMDSWYANPHMTVQAVNIPPRFMGVNPGALIAVNNLRLPAPAANWPGFVTGKLWLLMQKSISPTDLTLTWDLFEVGPTNYITGSLPAYQVFDRFPPVLDLSLTEYVVQRAVGNIDHLVVAQFNRPTDFVFGSGEVWAQCNGGAWFYVAPAAFSDASGAFWIEIPVVVGSTYNVAVVTINAGGFKAALSSSPQATITTTGTSAVTYQPPAQYNGVAPPAIGTPQPAGPDYAIAALVAIPPDVSGLSIAGGGTVFDGMNAMVTWNDATSGAFPVGLLKWYAVSIFSTGGTLLRSATVADPTFTYTYGMNLDDGGPRASFQVQVSAVSITGQVSPAATVITVTNSVPAAPTAATATGLLQAMQLGITYAAPEDINYLEVWSSATDNRSTLGSNPTGTTKTATCPHTGLGSAATMYYWFRVRDVYGQVSNWFPAGDTAGIAGTTLSNPTDLLQLLNPDVTSGAAANYLAGNTSLINLLDTRSMVFEFSVAEPGVTATYTQAIAQASSQVTQNQTLLASLNSMVSGLITQNYNPGNPYSTGQFVTGSDGNIYQAKISVPTGNPPPNVTYWLPTEDMVTLVNTIQSNLDAATASWTSTAATLTANISTLTGEVATNTTGITQNSTNISLTGQSITGPLAFVQGTVVQSGVQIESIADVMNLETRVSTVHINLDTANSNIALAASLINGLAGTINQVEIDLDAANALIALTATQTSLDALTDTVSTKAAQVDLDAANAAILLTASSADLSSQVSILDGLIGLKLNASGTVGPGLVISWTDGSHTKSNVTVQTDTFLICKPDGTGPTNVFEVGSVGGVSSVGVNGNLIVDGSVSATAIAAGELIVGTNVQLGTAQTATDVTTIIGDTITTGYVNALVGVIAADISATTIEGKTIQTASSGSTGQRIVLDSSTNLMDVYDDTNHLLAQLGGTVAGSADTAMIIDISNHSTLRGAIAFTVTGLNVSAPTSAGGIGIQAGGYTAIEAFGNYVDIGVYGSGLIDFQPITTLPSVTGIHGGYRGAGLIGLYNDGTGPKLTYWDGTHWQKVTGLTQI